MHTNLRCVCFAAFALNSNRTECLRVSSFQVATDLRTSINNIQRRMTGLNVDRDRYESELEEVLHDRRSNTWSSIDTVRTKLLLVSRCPSPHLDALSRCSVSLLCSLLCLVALSLVNSLALAALSVSLAPCSLPTASPPQHVSLLSSLFPLPVAQLGGVRLTLPLR